MSCRNIVGRAREVGLDIIAITDHNMVENGPYAAAAAAGTPPVVLFGMELQTMEEVHLLCLFPDYATAYAMQEMVYGLLPPVENDVDYFGDQVVVDENDRIVRFETRLLLNSSAITVGDAVSRVRELGGLVIPSHIDRATFGMIGQLGYVSSDVPFDALEVANEERIPEFLPFVMAKDLPFVFFSDAHCLADIGKRRTVLDLAEPTFAEVARAIRALGDTARAREARPHGGAPC